MINKKSNPVEWSAFMYELEDAKEHLSKLLSDVGNDPEYEEVNLRIDLGHVFAHLNRAWNRRDVTRELSNEEWERASHFPDDLDPV